MKKPNPYAAEISGFKRDRLRSIEKAKRAEARKGKPRGPRPLPRAPGRTCWLDARAHALIWLDAKEKGARLGTHLSRLALRGLMVENADAIAALDKAAAAALAVIPLPAPRPPEPAGEEDPPV